ncbi:hypothetical protein GW937_00855 [Candidatus Kaiserbacteria bacterium]|nr:hypothetical protein [Candidatus Kaiserbacteria bacterium]NCT01659.1 hypothetical protein [Candidatus Parcubacteria bacterium]
MHILISTPSQKSVGEVVRLVKTNTVRNIKQAISRAQTILLG